MAASLPFGVFHERGSGMALSNCKSLLEKRRREGVAAVRVVHPDDDHRGQCLFHLRLYVDF